MPDSSPPQIDALLVGKVRPYTRPDSTSAIDKRPVGDRVRIETLGLVGDEQADPRVHGGPDKAVHHYPFDHYAPWREELGELVSPGRLDARPFPQWPLRRLGALIFERNLDADELRAALELPLVPSWRRLIETRLMRREVEDWGKRIEGPGD